MARFKTTKKDFERWVSFFKEALDGYKLNNWSVKFSHIYLQKDLAIVRPDYEEEKAEAMLSTDWFAIASEDEDQDDYIQVPVTVRNLKRNAIHEVRHILLQPLACMLERYNAERDEIQHVEHIVIGKMDYYDYYKPAKKKKR